MWAIQCRLPLEQPERCVTPGTRISGRGLIPIILGSKSRTALVYQARIHKDGLRVRVPAQRLGRLVRPPAEAAAPPLPEQPCRRPGASRVRPSSPRARGRSDGGGGPAPGRCAPPRQAAGRPHGTGQPAHSLAQSLARRRARRQPSLGCSSHGRRSVKGVPRAAGTSGHRDSTTAISAGKGEGKGQAEGLSPPGRELSVPTAGHGTSGHLHRRNLARARRS